MKISKWLIVNGLWIVIFLAAILRLWKLSSIPPGLTPDEASLGYNAYSILKTGKDEYGQVFPIIFKSFGDYKPGLYVYLAIPFVALFGLNELAVRLPSAFAGVITVFLVYKIVSLFTTGRNLRTTSKQILIPLAVAFVAAINPWLISFSRGAWEANISLTLTLTGIYFFLRFLKSPKTYNLLLTALPLALTFVTYQGAKLSTTIVLGLLVFIYWKEFWKRVSVNFKAVVLSVVLAIIICLPVVLSLFSGQTGRLKVFSVFSYPRPTEYTQAFLDEGGEKIGDTSYYLYHSESLNFARGVLGRWFNHFSGKFLFFEGDYQNPKHGAPYSGMLELIDIILLPFGFIFLVRTKMISKKSKIFLFLWLVLSPMSAAMSKDQVQGVRALNMAIPLITLSGFGTYYQFTLLNKLKFSFGYFFLFIFSFIVSFVYYLDSYFVHLPVHNAKYWQYGFKDSVKEVILVKDKYDKVIFQQSYSQPYIYFLFYGKYDPSTYQKQAQLKDGGIDVGLVEKLDNIEFQAFSWEPAINASEKTLVIGDSVAIPPGFSPDKFNLIKEIRYPDGVSTAFRILEKK